MRLCAGCSGELSCVRTGEGWRPQSIVTIIVIIATVNSDVQHWLDQIWEQNEFLDIVAALETPSGGCTSSGDPVVVTCNDHEAAAGLTWLAWLAAAGGHPSPWLHGTCVLVSLVPVVPGTIT